MVCETWDLGRRGGHREHGLGGLRAGLHAGGGGVAASTGGCPSQWRMEESRAGFGVGRGGALMEGTGRGAGKSAGAVGLGVKGRLNGKVRRTAKNPKLCGQAFSSLSWSSVLEWGQDGVAAGREMRGTYWRGGGAVRVAGRAPQVQGVSPQVLGHGIQPKVGAENRRALPPPAGPVGPLPSFPLRGRSRSFPPFTPPGLPQPPVQERGHAAASPGAAEATGDPADLGQKVHTSHCHILPSGPPHRT